MQSQTPQNSDQSEVRDASNEEPMVTFEDYERFMQQIESDNRATQLQENNPRAIRAN